MVFLSLLYWHLLIGANFLGKRQSSKNIKCSMSTRNQIAPTGNRHARDRKRSQPWKGTGDPLSFLPFPSPPLLSSSSVPPPLSLPSSLSLCSLANAFLWPQGALGASRVAQCPRSSLCSPWPPQRKIWRFRFEKWNVIADSHLVFVNSHDFFMFPLQLTFSVILYLLQSQRYFISLY